MSIVHTVQCSTKTCVLYLLCTLLNENEVDRQTKTFLHEMKECTRAEKLAKDYVPEGGNTICFISRDMFGKG